MSSKNDSSQGTVADPKNPKATRVAEPDTRALMRADQRTINAKDAAQTRAKPAQVVSGKQDWHRRLIHLTPISPWARRQVSKCRWLRNNTHSRRRFLLGCAAGATTTGENTQWPNLSQLR
jgi:hypothetical protein